MSYLNENMFNCLNNNDNDLNNDNDNNQTLNSNQNPVYIECSRNINNKTYTMSIKLVKYLIPNTDSADNSADNSAVNSANKMIKQFCIVHPSFTIV